MTPTERRAIVEAIHDHPIKLVLAVAGGGNAVILDLLDVPGASKTVLEIRVPYAETSLIELVGRPIDAAVSIETAEAMAAACYRRAHDLASPEESVIGVGCTGALVSDRPKKGDHRAHVAVVTVEGTTNRFVGLSKGELDRQGEDRVVADAILDEIAAACWIDT